MDINQIISRLKKYPCFDIEKDGKIVGKQLATDFINAEMIADIYREYGEGGEISFIPKSYIGNSPRKHIDQRIKMDAQVASAPAQQFLQFDHQPAQQTFAGLGNPYSNMPNSNSYPQQYQPQQQQYVPQQSSGSGDLYKVLYDAKCNELIEANRKLEDERERRHKAELELSGSKNSVVGDIAQGLAGIAPMLISGMGGGAGLAGTPAPAQVQQATTRLQPVTDKRISSIVRHYATLDEASKQGIYELLDAIFADLSLIGTIQQSLNGIDEDQNEE